MGNIAWRQGERYLVNPDNTKPWTQELQLDTVGLEWLKKCLGPSLAIEKPVPLTSKDKGKELRQPEHGLCITIEYESADEAVGDIELSQLQDDLFYVQALRHEGFAHRAGIWNGVPIPIRAGR